MDVIVWVPTCGAETLESVTVYDVVAGDENFAGRELWRAKFLPGSQASDQLLSKANPALVSVSGSYGQVPRFIIEVTTTRMVWVAGQAMADIATDRILVDGRYLSEQGFADQQNSYCASGERP
jgi:hypothetical protein